MAMCPQRPRSHTSVFSCERRPTSVVTASEASHEPFGSSFCAAAPEVIGTDSMGGAKWLTSAPLRNIVVNGCGAPLCTVWHPLSSVTMANDAKAPVILFHV